MEIPKFFGDCIVWNGSISNQGYGLVRIDGKTKRAHVANWEDKKGAIPHGLVLDHLCRNRACINVDHLEPVTPRINTLRGEGPTARNLKKTHCLKGHILEGDNLVKNSPNKRLCLICQKNHENKYKKKTAEEKRNSSTKSCHRCRHLFIDGNFWKCQKLDGKKYLKGDDMLVKMQSEKYRNGYKPCFEISVVALAAAGEVQS